MNQSLLTPMPDHEQGCALGETRQPALLALLRHLRAIDYQFVTISPASHARVLARHDGRPADRLEDVLGWSRPFAPGSIDGEVERLLTSAGAIEVMPDGLHRSSLRVSTIHQRYFLHSAFPTKAEQAVFLGPDSYRFADFIIRELALHPLDTGATIVDLGTGSGIGAVTAMDMALGALAFMTDINPHALEPATINAQAAGRGIIPVQGRNLASVAVPVDFATANPPYIIDPAHRAYRDGGRQHGSEISLEMTHAVLAALKPGGRFLLYTGSAVVAGKDLLKRSLADMSRQAGCHMRYCEIDPDVFGEELDRSHYHDVDRIAVVSAVITKESN